MPILAILPQARLARLRSRHVKIVATTRSPNCHISNRLILRWISLHQKISASRLYLSATILYQPPTAINPDWSPLLKNLVLAAGILLAANFTCDTAASAATHHSLRTHRGATALISHHGRTRSPRLALRHARLPSFAGRRLASRLRTARFHAAHRRFAVAHLGRGRLRRHVALRFTRRHVAAVSRDAAIRSYVGPRSAYAPVSTPVGGAQVGAASFYSGGRTASGGVVGAATCAHRSLPFGTRVLVTNLVNGAKTVLTVNDRGPFVRGRILDVSRSAAGVLGMLHSGTARIAMRVVGGAGGSL